MRDKISGKLQAKTIGQLAVQSAGVIIKMEHMIGRKGSVGLIYIVRYFFLTLPAHQSKSREGYTMIGLKVNMCVIFRLRSLQIIY